MQLYNQLSAEERRELIAQAGTDRLTLSFYWLQTDKKKVINGVKAQNKLM